MMPLSWFPESPQSLRHVHGPQLARVGRQEEREGKGGGEREKGKREGGGVKGGGGTCHNDKPGL